MPVALVVEDEWLVRMEMADALSERGWRVVEVSTGEAAVHILRDGCSIDLLVTDIRLPGAITGWDVADAFRAVDRSVPVVYCSGNPPDLKRQARDSVFLSKPYRMDSLLEACERFRH